MPFQLRTLTSGPFVMTALLSTLLTALFAAHPWLPPYGVDRVGQGTDPIQADVRFEVTPLTNPVDLGCILPPHDWLLIGPGRSVSAQFAGFSSKSDFPRATVMASFETSSKPATVRVPLYTEQRATAE